MRTFYSHQWSLIANFKLGHCFNTLNDSLSVQCTPSPSNLKHLEQLFFLNMARIASIWKVDSSIWKVALIFCWAIQRHRSDSTDRGFDSGWLLSWFELCRFHFIIELIIHTSVQFERWFKFQLIGWVKFILNLAPRGRLLRLQSTLNQYWKIGIVMIPHQIPLVMNSSGFLCCFPYLPLASFVDSNVKAARELLQTGLINWLIFHCRNMKSLDQSHTGRIYNLKRDGFWTLLEYRIALRLLLRISFSLSLSLFKKKQNSFKSSHTSGDSRGISQRRIN